MFGLTIADEEKFHVSLSWAVIIISLPVLFIEIPISKTVLSWQWLGPGLPARFAWFTFESPNLLWSIFCVWGEIKDDRRLPFINTFLLALFFLHYIQRTVVFPLRMSPSSKKVPVAVILSALCYTGVNGYLQARGLCRFATFKGGHLLKPTSVVGLLLFFSGAYINLKSDAILRDLKTQNKGYQIPFGGVFEYVSGAQYFGEIVQWFGYALICSHTSATSFAVFTAANLIPRGSQQHKWYLSKFDDYPACRKAVIPFLW